MAAGGGYTTFSTASRGGAGRAMVGTDYAGAPPPGYAAPKVTHSIAMRVEDTVYIPKGMLCRGGSFYASDPGGAVPGLGYAAADALTFP